MSTNCPQCNKPMDQPAKKVFRVGGTTGFRHFVFGRCRRSEDILNSTYRCARCKPSFRPDLSLPVD
jgi:hypothetical protein